jgi:alkyl sulfatase BDS1-like metallo-beta-lactamase superfamily hydrolase
MSEFWNNGEEVAKAIIGMFDKTFDDPVIRAKGEGIKNLVLFNYHDPEVKIWVDSRGEEITYGSGDPPGDPDVQMSLSADDAHRTWSNKFNVMLGITRKKVIVTGNATKILKLIPLTRRFAVAYNEVLREMGKESIILK